MKKILVTGARGLLGSEFKERLDNSSAYFCDRDEMDITNISSVREYVNGKEISCIINCAAGRDAEYLEDNFAEAQLISVDGPKNLAIVANEINASIIHISTDYVFDGEKSSPYVETDKTNGLSVYGVVKAQGEQAVLNTANTALIFRTAWLFSHYGKDFVKTIKHLAETRDELNVIFDQIGSPCYAGDLATHILEIIPQIKPNSKEIYHLTNEGVCSWYDLAYEIVRGFGLSCNVKPIHTCEFSQKAKRPYFSVLDKYKFKRDFGIDIRHYSEGLADCISKVKRG